MVTTSCLLCSQKGVYGYRTPVMTQRQKLHCFTLYIFYYSKFITHEADFVKALSTGCILGQCLQDDNDICGSVRRECVLPTSAVLYLK